MKFLVFIRGEDCDLRQIVTSRIMTCLNPDINHVRAIKVSMNDYGPIRDKGERKAAASSVKKLVRKLLSGSHQEQFIVIDNPNFNQTDWTSILRIAEELRLNVNGVGIQVEKNEQTAISDQKNEKDPKLHMFKAMMYKYEWVENEQDIELVETILNDLIS